MVCNVTVKLTSRAYAVLVHVAVSASPKLERPRAARALLATRHLVAGVALRMGVLRIPVVKEALPAVRVLALWFLSPALGLGVVRQRILKFVVAICEQPCRRT